MSATITFHGAAGTVTGSRHLVETPRARVLVDCGLFQGVKNLRGRNWEDPPFDPSTLDAVVLTHAHIDHSGYLPRLRNLGYTGPVYCTHGTSDLLHILLPDAGYLQEADASRANRLGYTRHEPALPLYTLRDARACLGLLAVVGFGEAVDVAPGITAEFSRAGHILGSSCVVLSVEGTRVGFTGDVGRPNDPVMAPAAPLGPVDVLVTESTYGDRRHPVDEPDEVVARVVNEAVERGGEVLVPSFAVGRAQHLLHIVGRLRERDAIPELPVFLDSPMAIKATRVFLNHPEDHRLSEAECRRMSEIARYTSSADESKAIAGRSGPKVIISASGMATGGRVLHHLKRLLPDARNTVLFVGFQAPGTRGQALVDGTDEVKIHGRYVPVEARVEQVQGLSAHADYKELIEWLAASELSPRRVFVVHGEPAASDAFRRRLRDTFGWNAVVPDYGSTWSLDGGGDS